MAKKLDEDALRKLLKAKCTAAGGQAKWATTNSVSPAYVSDVLSGRRDPGESICRALGYKRQVHYIPDAWDDAWCIKKGQYQ